jgi:hypothetical protein
MVAATMLAAPPATAHRCTGDCDASDTIAVSELVVGVRIALGQIALDICPPFDADLNNRISINELQVAVNNVFSYCGHGSPPTPTSTRTPTRSPTPVEENSPGPTASPTATASAIEVVPSL